MVDRVSQAKSIFYRAIELDPSAQSRYLAEACGADEQLRREVETLLRFHDDPDTFLQSPVVRLSDSNGHGIRTSHGTATDAADRGAVNLDFLEPCDKPGCLGMLDRYEIIEVIGRGGMGVVLRGLDTRLNRIVAIKVLAPELAANAGARKRFEREAQAAAAVSHDHVVTIFAVDECGKLPYLVMECILGSSLQALIDESGALEVTRILRIGMQVAAGLAAAHQQGLIHRDIKPANILLENGIERVKITDFGLARAIDDVSVTRQGQTIGTPQYMSPEQADGKRIDQRSDLFSLGCVLYTLCTGRPAFRAETSLAVLRRVCNDTPRPIREINAEIPEWLVQIINRLLAKDPDQRFQTAAEVADLLSHHLAELQHPTEKTEARPASGPHRFAPLAPTKLPEGRRRLLGALLPAVVVLLGVLAASYLQRPGDSSTVQNTKAGVTSVSGVAGGTASSAVRRADDKSPPTVPMAAMTRPIKVFILAGDSNLGGRASLELLNYQATQPETRELYQHLREGDQWLVRGDVWIKRGPRSGNLTVGYGQTPGHIGPELEFGFAVGDHYDQQVLLIKADWSGSGTMFCDYRSPGAGPMPEDALMSALPRLQVSHPNLTREELVNNTGFRYRAMLDEVHHTLANLKSIFPAYAGQGYEIGGFVWFQGWNDMLIPEFTADYPDVLSHFIRDVREELDSPELPFVVGQLGVDGVDYDLAPDRLKFKRAQVVATERPEFQGNVKLVPTDLYWDGEAAAVFAKGWQKYPDEWKKVGSDRPYHYLGSARTFCAIGRAFGAAMIELNDKTNR